MESVLLPLFYKNRNFAVASESTKQDLIRLGLNKNNLFTVYNGVNSSWLKPIASSRKKDNQLLVLSRLKKYKGIPYAIKAMPLILKKRPDTKLLIVGKGSYEKKLKRLVKKLSLYQSVHFLGCVSEKKKVRLLKESSLLLHPSYKEGWGINVIEANACGTPVVASNVTGLCDSVIHGKTGLLVPYGDEKALARAVIQLLHNHALRKSFSKNAEKHAKNYSWDKSYQQLLLLLRKFSQSKSES